VNCLICELSVHYVLFLFLLIVCTISKNVSFSFFEMKHMLSIKPPAIDLYTEFIFHSKILIGGHRQHDLTRSSIENI
jgi:hypothetical protein